MTQLLNSLHTLWNQIAYAFSSFRFLDLVDILLVAYFIYKVTQFLKETRGGQLVKGLVVVLVLYFLSARLELLSVHWVLTKVVNWGIIALAVIFQPELRRGLERIGRSNVGMLGRGFNSDHEAVKQCIDSVCEAVNTMHESKVGALIVFERKTQLGEIALSGTLLNSAPSSALIGNIFVPNTPLHDGALIVRDGKLLAGGCVLPLTTNPNLNSRLGTRHRAAIGVSEVSDAVVVVVSEETGTISLVQNGVIRRGYTSSRLRNELYRLMDPINENQNQEHWHNRVRTAIGRLVKRDGEPADTPAQQEEIDHEDE